MNNDFRKLKRFKEIIADAYQDPGCGGRPTHNMFDRIARENPHLIGQDIVAFYFEIIKYLSDQKMIEFYGAYDKEKDQEVKWTGAIEEFLIMYKKFIDSYPIKKLIKEPYYFFKFEYCFVTWNLNIRSLYEHFDLEIDPWID